MCTEWCLPSTKKVNSKAKSINMPEHPSGNRGAPIHPSIHPGPIQSSHRTRQDSPPNQQNIITLCKGVKVSKGHTLPCCPAALAGQPAPPHTSKEHASPQYVQPKGNNRCVNMLNKFSSATTLQGKKEEKSPPRLCLWVAQVGWCLGGWSVDGLLWRWGWLPFQAQSKSRHGHGKRPWT